MRKVTTQYDPQSGTLEVYFDDVHLCDVLLSAAQVNTIRDLVTKQIAKGIEK